MLAELQKHKQKNPSQKPNKSPPTPCKMYCYNSCCQKNAQHPEQHHTIHWPIYSPGSDPTKSEIIWEHRLGTIFTKKSLRYKQVNIDQKFQQLRRSLKTPRTQQFLGSRASTRDRTTCTLRCNAAHAINFGTMKQNNPWEAVPRSEQSLVTDVDTLSDGSYRIAAKWFLYHALYEHPQA